MDKFVDQLLTEERICDIILPRMVKRGVLEENGDIGPRKSRLLDALEGKSDHGSERGSRSSSRSTSRTRSGSRYLSRSPSRSQSPLYRSHSRSISPDRLNTD